MYLATLPYWVAPLNNDSATRQQVYHTIRGIEWFITSPAAEPHARHRLDLPTVLGLGYSIKWYTDMLRADNLLTPTDITTILKKITPRWNRQLSDLNLGQIVLALAACNPRDLSFIINSLFKEYTMTLPEGLLMSLSSLEQALIDKDPKMPMHLKAIHTTLINYPENVVLLTDVQIASIIYGAEVLTQTEIVKAAAPKASKSTKKFTAEDL